MTPDYDVVLIGTGPPMLFEGLARARAGARVAFVDQSDQLGGSWVCKTLFGHSNIEVGVHLFENRREMSQLLGAILPDHEIAQSDGDFGLVLGHRIPMRLARVLLYGGIAGRNAIALRGERTRHAISHMTAALRNLRHPLIYPKGGIAALLQTIHTELIALGATFQMTCPVYSINIANHITTQTAQGPLTARHLVMSSRAHAPIDDLAHLWQNIPDTAVTTALLHLASPTPPNLNGYAEVINDPAIKRVRNVSTFADPPLPHGTFILAVQLRQGFKDRDPNPILSELHRLKLIPEGTRALGLHLDEVHLNTLPERALRQIEITYKGDVTVLRTVDLSDQKYKLST